MLLFTFLPEIASFLIFVFMGTQLTSIGPFLILGEFALVGVLFMTRPALFMEIVLRWWPLLLAPILAVVSALWSDAPVASARYGAQYLFTAFVGVLLARLMTPRRFVTVFLLAMFVFCVGCIINGRQGTSAEGWVLIGLAGSKNQLGYAAQLLLLAAITVLLFKNSSPYLRWVAVLSLPLAVFLLEGTNSATAVLMAAGGSAALLAMWFTERMQPGGRLAALIGAVVIIAPLSALTPEAIAWINHFVFDTLNKDPTLTGRTLLWEVADDLIARKPLLGWGYQAIWMGDSIDTIRLQRLTGITDGRVFHFHHQFRQIAVDTGLVGLTAFVGLLVSVGFSQVRQLLIRPDVTTSFFFVIFMLMLARAFTDVIIGPFSIHTLIFMAACTYAFWKPEQAQRKSSGFTWRLGQRSADAPASR